MDATLAIAGRSRRNSVEPPLGRSPCGVGPYFTQLAELNASDTAVVSCAELLTTRACGLTTPGEQLRPTAKSASADRSTAPNPSGQTWAFSAARARSVRSTSPP